MTAPPASPGPVVSGPAPSGHILALLREGTRQAHADIEAVPALRRLMQPGLTMAQYAAVLRRLHAFHLAVEPMVAAELSAVPDAVAMLDGARPRALADDLAWLAAGPARPGPGPGLGPPPVPELNCAAAALGALYVIEGASLGARVIARQLQDSLGVAPGRGGSFYCGQDADTARQRWRRLCALLETPLDDDPRHPPADAALLAGACDTFRCLADWMRQAEPGAVGCEADARVTT